MRLVLIVYDPTNNLSSIDHQSILVEIESNVSLYNRNKRVMVHSIEDMTVEHVLKIIKWLGPEKDSESEEAHEDTQLVRDMLVDIGFDL